MEARRNPSLQPATPLRTDDSPWLLQMQRRVILPLKLSMAALCLAIWLWSRDWLAPSPNAFAVFFVYTAFIVSEAYFLFASRLRGDQVRPMTWISYLIDVGFITALTLLDWAEPSLTGNGADYYILFVLMLLRGFSLFKTRTETLLAAGALGLLFLLSTLAELRDAEFLEIQEAGTRFVLVGFVLFLSMVVVDVLRRQQEEILATRDRLARSEALAQVGELAAGVAHEINNPIGIISTYSEYLLRLPECPNREDIEQIRSEARRCESIVAQLLDFARPSVAKLERIDIGALLHELRDFLLLDKSVQIPLTVSLPAEPVPPVLGDKALLRQALLNCALNARQIQLEAGTKDPRIALGVTVGGGMVRVSIRDNGPGLSAEVGDRAFDPFFTTRTGGTGLGLPIARRIVESHGGTLELKNHAEGGAEGLLVLPVAPERRS